MYLVEMTLAGGLRQEPPDACVQRAINHKVGKKGRPCALVPD